ncbi:MAG: 1-acyl-sn-glycerol-3-phosphate acyltransferase [Crocinitomicaceae bacterium]
MSEKKFIDVERVIREKNPKLLKRLPGFILRYLKRIIHEDEINNFIVENKDKKNQEFCQAVVDHFNIKIEVDHLERIPKEGKIVIAMNHPLGGMDAMILVSALQDHRADLKFIVNDILMNLSNLNELFVGVNKHGKNKASVRVQIEELFKSDQAVCIFPAGLVSRRHSNSVEDLEWKKTFVTYSRQYDRTIVPIYINGRLSNFFYRLSNWRKRLGIRANIEMLYLSNELFKQENKTMKFVVGEPISEELLRSGLSDRQLAQKVKQIVYDLKKEI